MSRQIEIATDKIAVVPPADPEKIPPRDFSDVLREQDCADQIGLWRGVNLVKLTLAKRAADALAIKIAEALKSM